MQNSNSILTPALVAWAFLPPSQATGAHAQSQGGIDCVKTAPAGQWHCLMNNPLLLTGVNPAAILMVSPAVPSDSNNGVNVAVGDLGTGNIELTTRRADTGAGVADQGATLMIYALPVNR